MSLLSTQPQLKIMRMKSVNSSILNYIFFRLNYIENIALKSMVDLKIIYIDVNVKDMRRITNRKKEDMIIVDNLI